MNRLRQYYQETIVPELKKEFGYTNDLAVPKLEKIIVNIGTGDVSKDKQNRDKVINYVTQIAGQKPQVRQAAKSIAEFGIRKGDPVGVKVTLRGERMYEFFDKLISIVLPRVRDFQGVPVKSFDQHGNYNLGLTEQIIFPEVQYDTIDRVRGLQITVNTSASSKEEALKLLKLLGMPFEKDKQQ